ncbi:4-alpha-glucanotransferase [Burkholderia ubonensis]|uniref:4-alpha-glucanotransferase n=1 Tax=Burkholderia ubonensis TaxID=101571 RepID=UPI002AB18825|nr:4-alpha-glucanotransferase [Burkholderia ubonensis]
MTAARDALLQLARQAGIAIDWQDAAGNARRVDADTVRAILSAFGLPCMTPRQCGESAARLREAEQAVNAPPLLIARCGEPTPLPWLGGRGRMRYRLHWEDGGTHDGHVAAGAGGDAPRLPPLARPGYHGLEIGGSRLTVAVAPPRCHELPDRARRWGLAVQMYSLRRAHDGGLGDFSALAELARAAAPLGAHALAVSPVHAMFSARPAQYSPYSPSNRRWYNVAHVDPAACCGAHAVREAVASLALSAGFARRESQPLVAWASAVRARLRVLRFLFERRDRWLSRAQRESLDAFRDAGGASLEHHARFEMLHARLRREHGDDWRNWPADVRAPESPQVERRAREHCDEVAFHVFLQWLARDGLATAQHAARDAGMTIGLLADLAVGVDPAGSERWCHADDMLNGVALGAPPDPFNPLGQSWGLSTFAPWALRQHGYRAFIDMLRAVLAHAGGVRIDHVLGFARLWIVPDGMPAANGAYLRYPLEDMLALVALESWRHRAIVLGEDLGTVPPDLRAHLSAAGLLGLDVLWFARNGDAFTSPARWRADAVATTSTHDLPTVAGWWRGRDIAWRKRVGHGGSSEFARDAWRERRTSRIALWHALRDEGLAPGGAPVTPPHEPPNEPPLAEIAAFVGRTPAPLALLPLEDAIGQREPVNLPGVVKGHPNWRRRLPAAAPRLLADARVAARLRAFAQARDEAAR